MALTFRERMNRMDKELAELEKEKEMMALLERALVVLRESQGDIVEEERDMKLIEDIEEFLGKRNETLQS